MGQDMHNSEGNAKAAWRDFVDFCERRHLVPELAIMAAIRLFEDLDPESRERLILRVTGDTEKFMGDRSDEDSGLQTGIVGRIDE